MTTNINQFFPKGFTFLEALLVIGLIFFFAGLILPVSVGFYKRVTVQNLAKELESSLREIQAAAMANRGESDAGIKIKPGEYIIFEGSFYETRRQVLDIPKEYPGGVEISGISEIVFQKETGKPIFPGLVSHWQLNSIAGNVADDYSLYQNLNQGVIVGNFSWVTGKDKKALELNSGQIEVPHHPSLNLEESLTFSLWVNIPQISSKTLIKKGDPQGNPPTGYQLSIDANQNSILFEIGDGQNTHSLANQFNPQEFIGNWVQIAAVWDGEIMKQYLNGKKLAQEKEFSGQIASSTNKLIIAQDFVGKIDDIRIYNRGLSEKDIKANYLSKKDDIVISLEFQNQKSQILISAQGVITASEK